MTTRWDVERALGWSNLRPLARLVVLALATKATADTAVIPDEHAPSLSTLTAMTGMARSQVAKELAYLDTLGWVKRSRPSVNTHRERTSYALGVGAADPDRPSVVQSAPRTTDEEPSSPQHGLHDDVQQSAARTTESVGPAQEQSAARTTEPCSPQHGLHVVRSTDYTDDGAEETPDGLRSAARTSPQHGHATTRAINQVPTTMSKIADEPRADVEALCVRLADWIEKNGSKRPTINKGWRDAARLLLDRDKRELPKALNLIDWCQGNDFWRANVLSMPKFRDKYDQLRLQATREFEERRGTRPTSRRVSTAEELSKWGGTE